MNQRRYDIDWLRMIAIFLLIIYHSAISFQSWGTDISFIAATHGWDEMWIFMAMFNAWRMPLLFLVSGMGVYFAMQSRGWKGLLKDRFLRIAIPFIFGFFAICPISIMLYFHYYEGKIVYVPNPGHLWFLGNIFAYAVLTLPMLIYLKKRPDHWLIHRTLSLLERYPYLLYPCVMLPILGETWLFNPDDFVLYAETGHGFFLGWVYFIFGILFCMAGEAFWSAVRTVRRSAVAIAVMSYLIRLLYYELENIPNLLMAVESVCGVIGVVGYASVYLNQTNKWLDYLSKAVYPVYIVHLPVQSAVVFGLFTLSLPVAVQICATMILTTAISFALYEFIIKRLGHIRMLFGMKREAHNYGQVEKNHTMSKG